MSEAGRILAVALGGALGAVARYLTGRLVVLVWTGPFPAATWTVNIVGSLLIGLIIPLILQPATHDGWRFVFVVGFLGAYTTFSTFSLDTLVLWEQGYQAQALINAFGSVFVGLLSAGVGLWAGRLIWS